jgi:hypothetical protein
MTSGSNLSSEIIYLSFLGFLQTLQIIAWRLPQAAAGISQSTQKLGYELNY